MSKPGKGYRQAHEQLAKKELYTMSEAVPLLKETSKVKFDATAEVHVGLNVDPKQSDQMVRGTVLLPHGSGRNVRIAAVVPEDKVKIAREAGADAAGLEDLMADFEKGKVDYDVIVAHPNVMKDLGKVAKVLGQKGMMPNVKSGTVTDKIADAIRDLKRGKVEFRADKEGNLHTIFGKVSFKPDELHNNLVAVLKAIREAKPSGVKGTYIRSITLCSTMGPGIRLDLGPTLSELSQ